MRSRILNPEFFKDEVVSELNMECRLAFTGLWCVADREGRFRWSPKRLKAEILPYDDIDFAELLVELERAGLIKSYDTDSCGKCGYIPNFLKYQRPHHREHASTIDGPCMDEARPKQVASCPPVSVSVSVSNSVSNSVSVSEQGSTPPVTPFAICETIKDEINKLCGEPIILKFQPSLKPIKDLLAQGIYFEKIRAVYRAVFDPSLDGDKNALWHRGKLTNATFGQHLLNNWGDLQAILAPAAQGRASKVAALNEKMRAKHG